MARVISLLLLGLALIGAAVFFFVVPAKVDASMNKVIAHAPYPVSDAARALHQDLRVADLHDDALLWDRDFLKRVKRGHSDAPRLAEGGYRLQVLAAVTKTPKNLNYDRNTPDSDNITLLAIAQRWPIASWSSLAERALYISAKLKRIERRSNGTVRLATSASDFNDNIARDGLTVLLATEGAHPLEGDLANLDRLYDAGYRILGLQHFFDNELGGSLHGTSGAGLTDFGRKAVTAALAKGMIIDVAHSSQQVVIDTLALSNAPLIVSHTGLKGHCDSPRNLPDGLIREIAARGGLIGVGFWDGAVCEASLTSVAAAIVYAVNLVGAEHVALGSDFDGATTTPFDAAEIIALTDALLDAGLDEATVRAVMGENAIRFFAATLPAE